MSEHREGSIANKDKTCKLMLGWGYVVFGLRISWCLIE